MRIPKWIMTMIGVYLLISVPAVYAFLSVVIRHTSGASSDAPRIVNRVPYTAVSLAEFDQYEYQSRISHRIGELVDSLGEEYEFAHNLPEGFACYGHRRFCQPIPGDSGSVNVLEMLDVRLDCGCPEELERFYLIRLIIDPQDLSVSVSNDEVRPWSSYVPRYRIAEI